MEDVKSLTTFLTAKPAPWADIAGSFELDFGHVVAPPQSLQQRDWDGDFKGDKTADFDTNMGHQDESQTIWHDDRHVL